MALAAAVDDAADVIRLVMYRDDTAVAATELGPLAAVRLAGELLDAADLRLAGELKALRAMSR